MAGAERHALGRRRAHLLDGLDGHVVDLGAGTGANLPHLGAAVSRVTALEPSPPMAARLRRRAARWQEQHDAEVTVIEAPAEAIPLPEGTADAVVATLVLCTVDDATLAIREIRRVLRDDGVLVLIEHVASDQPVAGRVQRALAPAWRIVGRGCHLHRPTRSLLTAGGFDDAEVMPWTLPGGGPAAPAITGVAKPR